MIKNIIMKYIILAFFVLLVTNAVAQNDSSDAWANHPFADFQFRTIDVTLSDTGVNYFDIRLLGTWISNNTPDKNALVISQLPNGCLIAKWYAYSKRDDIYYQHGMRIIPHVAKMDSTFFLEWDASISFEGKKYGNSSFIPCKYQLISDDEICFNRISRPGILSANNDQFPVFKTNTEYRDFLKPLLNEKYIFQGPYHYSRLKSKINIKQRVNTNDEDELIAGVIALMGAAIILDGTQTPRQSKNEFITPKVIGFDKDKNPVYSGGSGSNIKYDSYGNATW